MTPEAVTCPACGFANAAEVTTHGDGSRTYFCQRVACSRSGPWSVEGSADVSADASDDGRLVWSLRELLERPREAPRPVVSRLAFRGRAVLLAGREKSGKTTLMAAASAAVSHGARFLGVPAEHGHVLWATEEHLDDAVERLSGDFGANPDFVTLMKWREAAVEEIRREATRLRPVLTVVDTLQAVAQHAAPESGSASQWGRVIRPLVAVAHDTGSALVILHHARKAEGGGYRDSSEIGAAVDVIIEMTTTGGGAVRALDYKGRYGCGRFAVRLVDGAYELVGERTEDALRGEVIAFLRDNPGVTAEALKKGIGRRRGDVGEVLASLIGSGEVVDRGHARAHAYHLAESAAERPPGARGGQVLEWPGNGVRPVRPSSGAGGFSAFGADSPASAPPPTPGRGGRDGADADDAGTELEW